MERKHLLTCAFTHTRTHTPYPFSRVSCWWTPHSVRVWTVSGEEGEAMPAHAVKLATVYTNCTMKNLTQRFCHSVREETGFERWVKGEEGLSRSNQTEKWSNLFGSQLFLLRHQSRLHVASRCSIITSICQLSDSQSQSINQHTQKWWDTYLFWDSRIGETQARV